MKLSKHKTPIGNKIYFDLCLDTYIIGSYSVDESNLEYITPLCILQYIKTHFGDFVFSSRIIDIEHVMLVRNVHIQIPNLRFITGTEIHYLYVANIHKL